MKIPGHMVHSSYMSNFQKLSKLLSKVVVLFYALPLGFDSASSKQKQLKMKRRPDGCSNCLLKRGA